MDANKKNQNKNKKKKKKDNISVYNRYDLPDGEDLQRLFETCFEHSREPNYQVSFGFAFDDAAKEKEKDEEKKLASNCAWKIKSNFELKNSFLKNDRFEEVLRELDIDHVYNYDTHDETDIGDSDDDDIDIDDINDDEEILFERAVLKQCKHDKIGGYCKWVAITGMRYPHCKIDNCGEEMHVMIFQFDSKIIHCTFGEDGIGHLFSCPRHPQSIAFIWNSY